MVIEFFTEKNKKKKHIKIVNYYWNVVKWENITTISTCWSLLWRNIEVIILNIDGAFVVIVEINTSFLTASCLVLLEGKIWHKACLCQFT